MTTYTTGPWVRTIYHSPAGESFDIFTPAGGLVCNVAHEANARLIAAAPDLLEAAKLALEFLDDNRLSECACANDLAQAIAKAEGK